MRHSNLLLSLFPALLLPVVQAPAETPQYWQEHPVSAEEFYNDLTGNPNLEKFNTGEPFAWHSAGGGAFVQGYKIWKDPEWLDYAVRYYDFLLDHMVVAPDGYKGLLGRNFRHELLSDEEVSDALVNNQLLAFAELVLKDESLSKRYGEAARRYVEHARVNVIEKLDTRGIWHECGEYGDYIFDTKFVDPGNPHAWVHDDRNGSGGMSQKFNIANKLGMTNLYLYRITGDPFYRDKAERLFYRLKSNFQQIGDTVTWHYWVPFYEGDIFYDENRLIHWTAVHPYRPGYQAEEVHQIVEAYHNGVVFTEEDIQRIINTNLQVMWNGDLENPQFANSNGVKPAVTKGSEAFNKSHSGSGAANKGVLWASLVDFDPTIRTLYERGLENPKSAGARIRAAWYDTFIRPVEPGFQRHHAGKLPVIEKDVPSGDSREITVATVIPHLIKRGQDSVILTKLLEPGELSIDLYSRFGDRHIRNLYKGQASGNPDGQKGLHMLKWDGTDPDGPEIYEGTYLIRWSFAGGYRQYEIQIRG